MPLKGQGRGPRQVARHATPTQGEPDAAPMLGPFMQVVAALAESLEVLVAGRSASVVVKCAAASIALVVRYVAAAGAGEGPGAVPGLRCHPSSSPRQRCVSRLRSEPGGRQATSAHAEGVQFLVPCGVQMRHDA